MDPMQQAVNRIRAAALGALLCALPTAGAADPGLKFDGGPWIPALAIVSSPPGADAATAGEASLHVPLLALALEPEALGGSEALQRTLDAAGSGPVAIPARVSIEPAPGEDGSQEEEWTPAVLVIARADAAGPPSPPPTRPGQALEEREARPREEWDRWVPALALSNGILGQGADAAVASDVRPDATGSTTFLNPWMSASLELMSPSPGELPGHPQFFLHGDVGVNFGFRRDVAKEGSPGEFRFPDENPADITNDQVVGGQGSVTRGDPQPLLVTAGAGVAFTLESMGRRIRIRPSVEYLREELDVVGRVNRALIPPGGTLENVELIELTGSRSEVYHGLGPGLEIEADTARAGPVVLTLFVSGQAYRILGDRTTEFSTTDGSGHVATWTFKKDAWSWRGGVGLRFRWLPD